VSGGEDLYAETVELLRDISRNYHAANGAIEDDRKRAVWQQDAEDRALAAVDRLEEEQGGDTARKAIEESGAGELWEGIYLRAERERTGTDLRQRYCRDCGEPAHPTSDAFRAWRTITDDCDEALLCPRCQTREASGEG